LNRNFSIREAYRWRRPTGLCSPMPSRTCCGVDFTINGCFMTRSPKSDRLRQRPGGIKAKLVRAIGDAHARFAEDKLRILRAYVWGKTRYEIEGETWKAVVRWLQDYQVSSERVRDELSRILTEGQAARGFRR